MYGLGYLVYSIGYTLFLFSKIVVPMGILLLVADFLIRHFDEEDRKRQRVEAGLRAPSRLFVVGRRSE